MIDPTYINDTKQALQLALTPTPENIAESEKILDEILPQKGPLPAAFLMIAVDQNVPIMLT